MLFLLFFCCNKAHFCFPSLSVSAVTEKLVKSAKKGATRLERKLLLWQIVSVICRLCCTKKRGVVENCVRLLITACVVTQIAGMCQHCTISI